MLIDLPTTTFHSAYRVPQVDAIQTLAWIEEFSNLARSAIKEEDDEDLRRQYEDELLRRAKWLRAAGLFDIMHIRHPALRAMVDDAIG